MLKCIDIVNYALIEHCELDFTGGFNVVTGESGAGKSILMGAVEFLLGGRSDHGSLRTGTSRCVVAGSFSVPAGLLEPVQRLLEPAGVPFDPSVPELALRRVLTPGSVRNYINDVPVGARLLAAVGEVLIDRHGAGEQLSLMQPARQLELLDRYAGLDGLRGECAAACRELERLRKERAGFERELPDRSEADRLELMLEEIGRVAPEPGEDETLAAQHRLGSNSRQVIEAARESVALLTESEDSVADRLGDVYHRLTELSRIDSALTSGLLDELNEIQERIARLSSDIENLAEKIDLDAEALAAIESRLSEIYTLKRRYGPSLEQLFAARDAAEQRLHDYRAAAERRAEFDRMELEWNDRLRRNSAELSRRRRAGAAAFLDAVRSKLEAVGFPDSRLEAQFSDSEPGPTGSDRLELLFSANPGEAARSLRRVASSGELSRIMLAFKTVLADADDTATVIFDEIDMNIGGETANRVGDELRELGKKHQILCISHLAQVAARADAHYLAVKTTADHRTRTEIILLTEVEPELARMLGGGAAALTHARELRRTASGTEPVR